MRILNTPPSLYPQSIYVSMRRTVALTAWFCWGGGAHRAVRPYGDDRFMDLSDYTADTPSVHFRTGRNLFPDLANIVAMLGGASVLEFPNDSSSFSRMCMRLNCTQQEQQYKWPFRWQVCYKK